MVAAVVGAGASGGMDGGRGHARWLVRVVAVLALLAASLVELGPASALPGTPTPFDPDLPQAFLIQGDSGTTPATFVLQHAQVQPDGSVVYVNEGTVGIQANGIGFNAADGFVYATTYGNATPANTLIRIGQNGVWEIVKTPADADCTLPGSGSDDYLSGTVVGGFYYAFLPAVSATTSFTVQKVDLATCTRTSYTVTGLANPPSTVPLPFDVTFADGFFWGVNANGFLLRIPLSAGAVQFTNLAGILPSGNFYGAAWTMGNGNPVFQNNATGNLFQLDTTPVLSGNPPVLVSRVSAPTNTQNDGTFVVGQPVDLALDKTGVDLYQAPQQVTYTYVVHDNGPGSSSGAVVQDQLPAGMTYVSSSTACFNDASPPNLPACAAGDTNLGFSVPAVASGADYTFTVTVALAAGATGTKTNTATVVPNDNDTDAANNTGSTTMVPGTATITLDKQVASITDTNGNSLHDAGDVIHYTFLVTNTSPAPIVNVAVTDPLVGTVACPSTSLAPAASTLCTGSYPITQADVNAGSRSNTATASATTAGGLPTNQPSDSTTTPLDQDASIDLVKTPNRSALVAGQTVTYTFTATNTGTVTLGDVQVAEGAFNGSGAMSGLSCLPVLGSSLTPGASIACTATYLVPQTDVDRFGQDGTPLTNTATATGTPPTGPGVTDADAVSIPSAQARSLVLDKRVARVDDVNRNGLTDTGDEIHWEFLVTNTGGATVSQVAVDDSMVILVICDATVLAPGATTTCRPHANYVITQADVDAGGVRNTATAAGVDPGGAAVVTAPDSTFTPTDRNGALSLDKRIATIIDMNGSGTVDTGDQITYEFDVTNAGTVTLSAIAVDDPKLVAAGIPISCPSDPVPAGATASCTADAPYVVTTAEEASGGVHNVASASGVAPDGERHVSAPSRADVPTGSGGQGGVLGAGLGGDLGDTGMPPGLPWLALLGAISLGTGLRALRSGSRHGRPGCAEQRSWSSS